MPAPSRKSCNSGYRRNHMYRYPDLTHEVLPKETTVPAFLHQYTECNSCTPHTTSSCTTQNAMLVLTPQCMHTPWVISLAARLIPSTPRGVLPNPQPWHRAPRGGSQPRRGQGHRGSRGPVAGGMLLWLLPAGPWRAQDLGWGSPTPSSPVSTTTDGLVMAVYLITMAAD